MQGFSFKIQYIPGTKMGLADYLSRMYAPDDNGMQVLTNVEEEDLDTEGYMEMLLHLSMSPWEDIWEVDSLNQDTPETIFYGASFADHMDPKNPEYYLSQCHGGAGGRKLHHGIRRTYALLCKEFPGHKIPYNTVVEFVMTCPTCQKLRIGMVDQIKPLIKHLKPEHHRKAIGFDTLTVTPPDDNGNQYLDVIVDHYIKHCQIYPYATHSAETTATSLFSYLSTWGRYEKVFCDPGSDLTSDLAKELIQKWMGAEQVIAIVDRHESNGVEGTNKQILRHLRALVHDERMKKNWSHPSIIKMIEWTINSVDNSEVGITPIHARFGTEAATYFQMPADLSPEEYTTTYCKFLDENLRIIRDVTKKHQEVLIAERTAANNVETQNRYQPGDFILYKPNRPFAPSKLHPLFEGPYEVLEHIDNDINCVHVATRVVKKFHVETVKIFHGTPEDALKAAMIDNDQYKVKEVKGYLGNPLKRKSCTFLVEFEDGDVVWKYWDYDLYDTVAYENFCKSRSELRFLHLTTRMANESIRLLNSTAITEVSIGDRVFVDIRCMGSTWYRYLNLPNAEYMRYVIGMEYVGYPQRSRNNHLTINAHCAYYSQAFTNLNHCWVLMWGCNKVFVKEDMVLVNDQLCRKYPNLMSEEYEIPSVAVPDDISTRATQAATRRGITTLSPYIGALSFPTLKKPFTIMSFNCNSLKARQACVKFLLNEHKPDLLFLQETKCMDKDFPATLREYNGYHAYMCGRQQHQGVAAFSKQPSTDVLTAIPHYPESMYRYMELTVANMRFINIYAPQGQQLSSTQYAEKVIFYQKLIERVQALISNNILPIIAGDFNILPTSLDLFNPDSDTWRTNCMCSPAERSWFNRLLQLGYIDAFAHYFPDTKRPYTWWNTENDFINRRGFRLDYFLIPNIYLPYMQQPTVLSDLRLAQSGSNPSDHAPIFMTLSFFQTNLFQGEGEDGHDMLTTMQA